MMAFATATFVEVLDDLSSRFIINVPDEELASVERICFQVEQAHWYYEDFIREQNPSLPSFSLKQFSAKIFRHCPLLQHWADEHEKAYGDFLTYKFRVPVCGAIILNETLDKCLLVKGWTSKAGWGFPRGKINKDESYASCAAREVMEETGFDLSPLIDEEIYLERTIREQHIRLFIIPGIPEKTQFNPQTRKEISKISWYKLLDLPTYRVKRDTNQNTNVASSTAAAAAAAHGANNNNNNRNRFYMVIPFVNDLRRWIERRRQGDAASSASASRRGSLACTVTSNVSNATSHVDVDSERIQIMQNNKNRQGGQGKKEHRRTRSKYQNEQTHMQQLVEQHATHPVDSNAALLEYLNKMSNSSTSKTNTTNALFQLNGLSDDVNMSNQHLHPHQQRVSPAILPITHQIPINDQSNNAGDRLLAALQGKPVMDNVANYSMPPPPPPPPPSQPQASPLVSHVPVNLVESAHGNNSNAIAYNTPVYNYSPGHGPSGQYSHVYASSETSLPQLPPSLPQNNYHAYGVQFSSSNNAVAHGVATDGISNNNSSNNMPSASTSTALALLDILRPK